MYGMVSGAVDAGNAQGGSVVDVNGPHGDENEGDEMHCGVEREQKYKGLIGGALQIAVERMKGEGSEGGGVDEGVMWLVDVFVEKGVMQTAMDKVDDAIAEGDEQKRGDAQVEIAVLGGICVDHSVTKLDGDLGRGAHCGHDCEGADAHCDFAAYLDSVLVAGREDATGEELVVEQIVQGGEEEVDEEGAEVEEEPGD